MTSSKTSAAVMDKGISMAFIYPCKRHTLYESDHHRTDKCVLNTIIMMSRQREDDSSRQCLSLPDHSTFSDSIIIPSWIVILACLCVCVVRSDLLLYLTKRSIYSWFVVYSIDWIE